MLPRLTKARTIPLQKLKLRSRGPCLFSKPARKATVIGSKDKEHGPRLVSRPPQKTINIVIGPGSFRPWLSSCSLLRARSDKVRSR